jgi:DNA-binding LacI/PurR family transcriptional regulator
VVLADRQIPNIKIDSVCTNNFEGAYQLTKYLINLGHEKIAVILSSLFNTERERLEGYKKALHDSGISLDSNLIYASPEPFSENLYGHYVKKILAQKREHTAIFCGHDRIAFLFYTAAREIGIKFPEDLSIVGYDDLPFTHTHPLALTTMHQPIYEIGKESMKLILARIQNPQREAHQVILKSHLV